jgi:hypothetical protein
MALRKSGSLQLRRYEHGMETNAFSVDLQRTFIPIILTGLVEVA